jgi:PAS domain S-box-containing protein
VIEEQHPVGGEQRWHRLSIQPIRDADGAATLAMVNELDITERMRADQALSESQLRVELALQGANLGTWDWYVQTGAVVFNKRWAEIVGYTLAELEPLSIQTWAGLCHPDDLERSNLLLSRHFAGESEFYECEARMRHRRGDWVWVIDRGKVVEWDGDGRPIRMAGTHLDISERKVAELALLDLNRTLEARVAQRAAEVQDLYDYAPIGYLSLDAEGALTRVNQTLLSWVGRSADDLIGQPLAGALAPASRAAFAESFAEFKRRGDLHDLELTLLRSDGSEFPVLINATAIYDPDGAYVMSRTTVFDITQRKQAEAALRESEAQNRLLFEEAPDAVALFGEGGVVVQANRAFEELAGVPREQLTGRTLEAIGLATPEQIAQLSRTIAADLGRDEGFATAEFGLRRASGEVRHVGARIFGLQIRGQGYFLTTMRDITAEKQAEAALRQANAELARAARAKDEFLANMSHELRSPLNAILGYSESLQEGIFGALNERQQSSLLNIEASGRHLLALINDILDLSKVEAGRLALEIERIAITDICQASMVFVKEIALKKSLRLAFQLSDQMAEIDADPKRLKQMLVNLLSNAVKFTPSGGQVSLEVAIADAAGTVAFTVRDTGIGIAPEDLTRLFRPFSQLDSRLSRQHEGTGLGLALVRRLAELHGGSVTVESELGKGSAFTITLPSHQLSQEGAVAHQQAPAARAPGRDGMVTALVVEDSRGAAEQIARYLREANVRVVIHPRGADALEQAIGLRPDLIILDLLMPDRPGWEVLSQLKASPITRDIPVIIVSVVDDRPRGLAAGAAEHLVKPITREVLWEALRVVTPPTREPQQALIIVPQAGSPHADTRVLIAEDNEMNAQVTGDYLRAKGFSVLVARNGREALAAAVEHNPDLIVMDIQMPEIDGLALTRYLRAMPVFAATPIIALTALAMPGDRERCLAAGASLYMTKPVSLGDLSERIAELLGR